MEHNAEEVTDYYDKNTKKFLRFGQGGAELSIHRAVWGPGIHDRSSAMHFVDNRVAETAQKMRAGRVLDLGCGCGGSLVYVLKKYPDAEYYGITVSRVQQEYGDKIVRSLGLPISLYAGSYLDPEFYRTAGLPRGGSEPPSLFFAVESFIHCPSPERFFQVLGEAAVPGDQLLICDDFLVLHPQTGRFKRLLQEFTAGWRAVNVMHEDEALQLAEKNSFHCRETADFTAMLELNRPRDRLIRFLIPLVRAAGPKQPYLGNLLGGNALQRLLEDGILNYKLFIFERAEGNS